MTGATAWRRELAKQVAAHYAGQPKIAAVALAGSVARGWADLHSDIELDLYWAEPPTVAERLAPITAAGGQIDIFWADPPPDEAYKRLFDERDGLLSQLWPYEDDEWSEHYYIKGINIGVSGFLTTTIERYLDDVLLSYATDDERQIRLAAIQHAAPLHGAPLLERWQTRASAFPGQLAAALIEEQLALDEEWWAVDMWLERDAHLPLIELLHHMEIKILRILLALNRIYLPDPRFKWAGCLVAQMAIRPPDLESRLKQVFRVDPAGGVKVMEEIFYEILDLVQEHAPEVDMAFIRRWYRHRRPVNRNPG
jgi:hypothetical protein